MKNRLSDEEIGIVPEKTRLLLDIPVIVLTVTALCAIAIIVAKRKILTDRFILILLKILLTPVLCLSS